MNKLKTTRQTRWFYDSYFMAATRPPIKSFGSIHRVPIPGHVDYSLNYVRNVYKTPANENHIIETVRET